VGNSRIKLLPGVFFFVFFLEEILRVVGIVGVLLEFLGILVIGVFVTGVAVTGSLRRSDWTFYLLLEVLGVASRGSFSGLWMFLFLCIPRKVSAVICHSSAPSCLDLAFFASCGARLGLFGR